MWWSRPGDAWQAETGLLRFGLGVDFQTDVNLRTIVKLADGFRSALLVVVLCIHLVIDAGLKRRKTVGSVRTNDVGLHGAGVSVGQIHDRVRQRIVAAVQHFASE